MEKGVVDCVREKRCEPSQDAAGVRVFVGRLEIGFVRQRCQRIFSRRPGISPIATQAELGAAFQVAIRFQVVPILDEALPVRFKGGIDPPPGPWYPRESPIRDLASDVLMDPDGM